MRTTRCGKIVGSYKPPLSEWVYWPEADWRTKEPGFVVVAPSGARMDWFPNEAEAIAEVDRGNAS